jgi:hypothetical protein
MRIVYKLSGIFFHVYTGNADAPSFAIDLDKNMPVFCNGKLILGYLVPFGEIGIEVVLPGKPAFTSNGAICSQSHTNGVVHHLAVQDRKHPGHPEAHRASVGVGRCPKLGGATAKDLGLCQELGMYLKTNYGFIIHLKNLSQANTLPHMRAKTMGQASALK